MKPISAQMLYLSEFKIFYFFERTLIVFWCLFKYYTRINFTQPKVEACSKILQLVLQ